MTGEQLRTRRLLNGLKLREVAEPMGVSIQRVNGLEGQYRPTTELCDRYLRAVDEAVAARTARLTPA